MTPPKSVESMQTPLSNKPSVFSSTSGANANSNQNSTANMPPISYDYLNNIFEEESSADEQQQNANGAVKSVETAETVPVANALNNNFSLPNVLSSVQSTISVVMTPPSHESINVNHINGVGVNSCAASSMHSSEYYDEMSPFNNTCDTNSFPQINSYSTQTKSINLNDYNTLTNNKRRPLLTNLLQINANIDSNFTAIMFDIPLLSKFTRETKYKRVNLINNQKNNLKSVKNLFKVDKNLRRIKKLKWSLSSNANSIDGARRKSFKVNLLYRNNRSLKKFSNKNKRKATSSHLTGKNNVSKLSLDIMKREIFNKDSTSYLNIQSSKQHPQYIHLGTNNQQNKLLAPSTAALSAKEPLAPPPPPPPLESQSNTPLGRQNVNPSTPQQYVGSVSSPYYQQGYLFVI